MIIRRTWELALCFAAVALSSARADTNHFVFRNDPSATFNFQLFVGDRIRANVENWLLPAPSANPGMLSMFEVRDREPAPNLVPWAGEFVGKYLISAIQAIRVSRNAELPALVENVVAQLIASQAEDGYLGPFRKHERLLGHWDLWGHYHCMLALLMWHEHTGRPEPLIAARRAADLVCNTFLDTGKRAIDAGSDEMNLSIIHSLGWLYRITEEPRYLRMIREIEMDWERGGDYLRTGLAGTEFFQTPRPRWESLHNIQGLVELYRITGNTKYRDAFANHWRSIARWDLRNTGGFSSGEQATGNPYSPTAIETCCTIAWMALCVDALALFGDVAAADLLELATFNAWAGAQHPSGRWCTYNTPMDGVREASAHSIVFQSRHGAPELNCCSVNGPRGWGMLSEWAFQNAADGFVINWLAPASFVYNDTITNPPPRAISNAQTPAPTALPPGRYSPLYVQQLGDNVFPRQRVFWVAGNYPVDPEVTLSLQLEHEEEFTVHIRIPEWSRKTEYRINEEPVRTAVPGRYLSIRRKWRSHWNKSDSIQLTFDLTPRAVPGAREAAGKMSVYRGPILLAADQAFNRDKFAAIDWAALKNTRMMEVSNTNQFLSRALEPMFFLRVPTIEGYPVTLCDFASAGAKGTRYRSWLATTNAPPAPVMTRLPRDSATIAAGTTLFRWTSPQDANAAFLEMSSDPDFEFSTTFKQPVTGREAIITIPPDLAQKKWCYWRVVTSNRFGLTPSRAPHARFRVDTGLPAASEKLTQRKLDEQGNIATLTAPISFDGNTRKIFEVGEWPEEEYSARLRFRLRSFPTNRMAQLFSAWAGPMDDPLRITIQNGRLFARIESGANYSTEGVPIDTGRWYDVIAEKKGSKLSLTLDGKERASATVPEFISTRAKDFAVGGNPHFEGNEFLEGDVEKVEFDGF